MPRKKNKRKAVQADKEAQKPKTKRVISIAHHSPRIAMASMLALLISPNGIPEYKIEYTDKKGPTDE